MIGPTKNNTKNITTACHGATQFLTWRALLPACLHQKKKQTAQFSDTTRLITPNPNTAREKARAAQSKARIG
jgi:hypothetical protein